MLETYFKSLSVDRLIAHKLYNSPLEPSSVRTKVPSADAVVFGTKEESNKKIRPFARPAATRLILSRKISSITSEVSSISSEYENK